MRRNDLAQALAAAAQVPQETAARCLDALFGHGARVGIVEHALSRQEKVQWTGFGTFEARSRPERWAHHPRTGERIRVAAATTVGFRAATTLRRRLQAAVDPSPGPAGRTQTDG